MISIYNNIISVCKFNNYKISETVNMLRLTTFIKLSDEQLEMHQKGIQCTCGL